MHQSQGQDDQHQSKSEFRHPNSLDYSARPYLYAYPQQQQRQPFAVTTSPVYTPPSAPYSQFPPFVMGPVRGQGGTWWYVPPRSQQPQPHIMPASPTQPFPSSSPSSLWTTQQQPSLSSSSPVLPSSSPSSRFSHAERRAHTRRTYPPNPPATRSEWVMWVGNVPGNVKHDELWHFFSHDRGPGPGGAHENRNQNGVLSIFLISRSRCAFVNYETEDALQAAIEHFDGMVMSAADPRAARLVCRVRKNGDDVQAGVGGQRGKGLHVEWVKKQAQAQSTATRVADRSNKEQPSSQSSNSSTPSDASTTSSFLETHFPQRFFILKSLTQANIDTSVSSGLWATQRHNEDVLNRAFCTAKDVFLIFSVNKSGGFCGCARMQGTIGNHGSGFIKWDMPAPKDPSPGVLVASPKPLHPNEVRASPFRAGDQVPRLLSAPVQTSLPLKHDAQTAPPHFGQLHHAISFEKPNRHYSLGQRNPVELPPKGEDREESPDKTETESWGRNFQLHWLSTAHIPFERTQHIHNLWNHNRQVKVSRDGTEVDPGAGQLLLANWK